MVCNYIFVFPGICVWIFHVNMITCIFVSSQPLHIRNNILLSEDVDETASRVRII